jgi:hypothetical protein
MKKHSEEENKTSLKEKRLKFKIRPASTFYLTVTNIMLCRGVV